jgi:ketosteroid isomerase-like protein
VDCHCNPEFAMRISIHPYWLGLIAGSLLLAASSIALAAPATPAPALVSKPAPLPKPATNPKPAMSAAECAVWDRERSFAQSVEAHDAVAFAEHIREDAVFEAGTPVPTRGRAEIVENWKDTIAGKGQLLRWYPDIVTIGGNPDIALSHGVFWLQDDTPNAKQRYRTGSFNTIWQKGADGVWKVLFDWGGLPPVAVTAEELAKLKAALPASCPRG